MRKLSLLLAVLMTAAVFQTASAGEDGRPGCDRRFGREAGRNFGRRFDRDAGQEFAAPGNGQFGPMGPRFMEELNLTPEQKTKMIDAATENFRERLTLRWEMQEARNTLQELRDSDSPDYDAIIAANTALGAVQGKLDVARRKVGDDFAALLTPEQLEKVEAYREDREERREEMIENFRERREEMRGNSRERRDDRREDRRERRGDRDERRDGEEGGSL